MNRRGIVLVTVLFLSFLLIAGCAGGATSVPTLPTKTTETIKVGEKTWEQEWNKLLVEAKKEGKLVMAASAGVEVRNALAEAFTGKYGIQMEFVSGKPMEIVPKMLSERRAGLYLVDLFMAGIGTVDNVLAPEGALEPLDSVLILPEVTDKKAWWGGDLLWADSNHFHVMYLAFPRHYVTVNKDLVRGDEIKSYRDLLNPKWKGKIMFLDPTLAGGGSSAFTALAEGLMDMDYLRELGKQELVITRDNRLIGEWVARGKYPIAIGLAEDIRKEFRTAGAPIEAITLAEGSYIGSSGGGLVLMNKAPHPNAARLFINWQLTREGGIVGSKMWGGQSAREDVPTDFLEPEKVRQPGVKYRMYAMGQESALENKYRTVAKEMWGHLIK